MIEPPANFVLQEFFLLLTCLVFNILYKFVDLIILMFVALLQRRYLIT